jgi:hypothetical protein
MTEENLVPEEFTKVIRDFVGDIQITFPEYKPLINKWWYNKDTFNYIDDEEERKVAIEKAEMVSISFLFTFCKKKFPERFFDILYQNEEMFQEDSTIDTEFLPHILFKNLWSFDITQKTRDTIWKYLQLIMFSIVGTIKDSSMFGDSAKLFEAINEDEFKTKLEETLSQMKDLFEMPEGMKFDESAMPNINMEDMPKAEQIHEHMAGLLDGKLGKLAKEIAEETAESLNMDMENTTDMKDIFSNLVKNPSKLMGLVKKVGDKLDTKIKSGDIKESELIAEATDLMNKMKNMPGMGNIQSMLNKMGFGGKMNTAGMEAQMNQNMKQALNKERMKAKAEAIRVAKENAAKTHSATASFASNNNPISDEEILKIFSTGEKAERTPRTAAKPQSTNNNENVITNTLNNEKKGKKGKKGKK